MPAASRASTTPAHERRLGPDDDEVGALARARARPPPRRRAGGERLRRIGARPGARRDDGARVARSDDDLAPPRASARARGRARCSRAPASRRRAPVDPSCAQVRELTSRALPRSPGARRRGKCVRASQRERPAAAEGRDEAIDAAPGFVGRVLHADRRGGRLARDLRPQARRRGDRARQDASSRPATTARSAACRTATRTAT